MRLPGSTRAIDLDIRVIAATHRKLTQRIRTGEFREDLFFRLATFRLAVPAPCERPGDIVPLACTFLSQHVWRVRRRSSALRRSRPCARIAGPGTCANSRTIQRALVLPGGEAVGLEHLMFDYDDGEDACPAFELPAPAAPFEARQGGELNAATAAASPKGCLLDARDAHERSAIEAALRTTGSRAEAAERLGISPRTLRYRMARLRERGHAIPRSQLRSCGHD